jgi:coenzyme PQQ synthesis protein D (PqqD)
MKTDRPSKLPKVRADQLIVKELTDETLIYDLKNDKAYCLNSTAALVWKSCDGENSIAEINLSLAKETKVAVDEKLVWLALDQLASLDLLEKAPTTPTVFAGISRRQIMKIAGVAAIALPVVTSIIAPTPAQAASNIGFHQPCCAGDTCSGGSTCRPHPTTPPCNMWCG